MRIRPSRNAVGDLWRAQLLPLLLLFLQRWVAAAVSIWSWSHLGAANHFANSLSLFCEDLNSWPFCGDHVGEPVFLSSAQMMRFIWGCWFTGFACNCGLNASLCLCVCVCVWLMVVLVEAVLLWLQPQAAPGFSLTYDNAPVTLTPEPCSVLLWVDVHTFFFLSFHVIPVFFSAAASLLARPLHTTEHCASQGRWLSADGGWYTLALPNARKTAGLFRLQTQAMMLLFFTGRHSRCRLIFISIFKHSLDLSWQQDFLWCLTNSQLQKPDFIIFYIVFIRANMKTRKHKKVIYSVRHLVVWKCIRNNVGD